MPDIEFVNSSKSEEKRWKHTRKEVANGWFVSHGFLVVPELVEQVGPQIQVVFPEHSRYEKVEVRTFQRDWEGVEEKFWMELDHFLPEAKKMHTKIRVDVGRIGTVSSSYWTTSHYYLRVDRSIGDLAAMIINNIMFIERKSLGVTWTKREALMDFIMTRPAMQKLFPHFRPVFAQLSRVPKKVRERSEAYVRSLGILPAKQDLERVGAKIWIKGSEVGRELTKMEKKVLGVLIDHRSELVTYDGLADTLWGVGEFKTYWAINKVLERLRIKLGKLGVDEAKLESVRGQGYILS